MHFITPIDTQLWPLLIAEWFPMKWCIFIYFIFSKQEDGRKGKRISILSKFLNSGELADRILKHSKNISSLFLLTAPF